MLATDWLVDPRLELWPHDVLVNNSGATAWRYPSFTAKWGKYNHAISLYIALVNKHCNYEDFSVKTCRAALHDSLRIDIKQTNPLFTILNSKILRLCISNTSVAECRSHAVMREKCGGMFLGAF